MAGSILRRNRLVQVHVSEAEHQRLTKAAHAEGLTLSEFVRQPARLRVKRPLFRDRQLRLGMQVE